MNHTETQAEVKGSHLIVRLPIWQIVVLIGGGALVVASVWLTTRDLGMQVSSLNAAVTRLSVSVEEFSDTTQGLRDRVLRLETKVDEHEKQRQYQLRREGGP